MFRIIKNRTLDINSIVKTEICRHIFKAMNNTPRREMYLREFIKKNNNNLISLKYFISRRILIQ